MNRRPSELRSTPPSPRTDSVTRIPATEGGQTIRTTVTLEQFRLVGRATGGVRAIDVPEGDRLVSMAWVRPSAAEQAGPAELG